MRILIACTLIALAGCASDSNGFVKRPPEAGGVRITTEWRSAFGLGNQFSYNLAAPIISGRSLIVASPTGYVYALDAKTGDRKWRRKLEDAGLVGKITLVDGKLYIPTAAGVLYKLEAIDGAILRQYQIPPTLSAPLIIRDSIILQDTKGNIIALDLVTGQTMWRFVSDVDVGITTVAPSSPLLLGDVLLVGLLDGSLILLEAMTGRQLAWQFALGKSDAGRALARITNITALAMYDTMLLATARSGGAVRLDNRRLQPIWQNEQLSSLYAPTIVSADYAFAVHPRDNSVFAYSPTSGKLIWQHNILGTATSLGRVVVSGDFAAVATDDGELCVLDMVTGRLQRCQRLSALPLNAFMTVYDNFIYLSDTQGFVLAVRITKTD